MTRIDPGTAARLGVATPAERSGRYSEAEETFAVQCRQAGMVEPQREFQFHPTRKWRLDFAWPLAKVALEVEGGIYPMRQADGSMRPGRHTSPKAFELDAEKYNEAAVMGWCILRATARMVKDGRALAIVEQALAAAGGRHGIPTRWTTRSDDD